MHARHAYFGVMEGSQMPKDADRAMAAGAAPRSEAARRARDWLSRGGMRHTRQRLALAELLVGDGDNRHVTAESLAGACARSGHSVSLATIYNTLRAFCDVGLMREIVVDGARSYFDTRTDDHPHFFWEDDGTLSDAPAGELEISRLPAPPEGAEMRSVDVVIRLRRLGDVGGQNH